MQNKYTLTKEQVAEYFIEVANAEINEVLTKNVRGVRILETKFIYFLNALKDKTTTDWNKLRQIEELIINRVNEVVYFIYEELGGGKVETWWFEDAEDGEVGPIPTKILNEDWLCDLITIRFSKNPEKYEHAANKLGIHSSFLYMTNEEIKTYMETLKLS